MKELLQKIAANYIEIAKAAKEGDTATLIAKLDEGTKALEDATAEAETVDETATTQGEEIAKMKEQINKWAYLDIGAETFTQLIADVKSVTDQVAGLATIAKTVPEITTRLTTVEKTAGVSVQSDSETTETVEKTANPLSSAASRFQ